MKAFSVVVLLVVAAMLVPGQAIAWHEKVTGSSPLTNLGEVAEGVAGHLAGVPTAAATYVLTLGNDTVAKDVGMAFYKVAATPVSLATHLADFVLMAPLKVISMIAAGEGYNGPVPEASVEAL